MMHLHILLECSLVMMVTKVVDCTIDGWSYMNPMRQQMPFYRPIRTRCIGPCKPLYWYPRPMPDLYYKRYKFQCQQKRPRPLNQWPAPASPSYSWPAQPEPSNPYLPTQLSTPCPALPPPRPCPTIPPSTPCPKFMYPPTPQYANPSSPQPTIPPTITSPKPLLSSTHCSPCPSCPSCPQTYPCLPCPPPSPQLPLQQPPSNLEVIVSQCEPSQLEVPMPIELPLITNVAPEIPQPHLQLTNFPAFPPPFPIAPSLSLIPQIEELPDVPGLVSSDVGINIMPFSDVYTDLFEKYKNKVARKQLRKLIRKFRHYQASRDNVKSKEYTTETVISEEETEEEDKEVEKEQYDEVLLR